MTEAQLRGYRQRLLALAARLNAEVSDLRDEALRASGGEASGGLSDTPVHLGDLAGRESVEDALLGVVGNEEHLLAEVNDALARIDRRTFGGCEACGQPIPHERLHAVPYARHCVVCAGRSEAVS